MPRTRTRRGLAILAIAGLACSSCVLEPLLSDRPVRGEAAAGATAPAGRSRSPHPFPGEGARSGRRPEVAGGGSGAWWLGTTGLVVALAAFGALSLALRRARSPHEAGQLAILGRIGLSPRHAVFLLKAGDRTLIVGTGVQGPPAILGELDDPIATGPAGVPIPAAAPGATAASSYPPVRFDPRIGGEA